MDVATLSSKYQLVIPRGPRERLGMRPGMRLTVIEKGGVIFLVPERPIKAFRGIVKDVGARPVREKRDRL
jgi:AbrB family looped-hinge helix DNA binding protein